MANQDERWVHFTFGANELAATQSDVRLRGQHLLPTQVGMAMACCDLQSPQLAPKLKCTLSGRYDATAHRRATGYCENQSRV